MLPPNAMISARSGVGGAGKAQGPSSAKGQPGYTGQPGYRVTTSPARAAEAWAAFTISTVRMPTPASGCG